MKVNKLYSNEQGVAHLGLILLAVVVIAVGGFAVTRVMDANKDDNKSESSQTVQNGEELPESDDESVAADEAVLDADKTNESTDEGAENVTE